MVNNEAGSPTENIGKSGGKIGLYAETAVVQGSHITDYTASTTLTDPPTKAEVEAQLALIATAVNSILTALENIGVVASA